MVNYKVNLKFKDAGKPLNEVITEALKIEIKKRQAWLILLKWIYHLIVLIIPKKKEVVISDWG